MKLTDLFRIEKPQKFFRRSYTAQLAHDAQVFPLQGEGNTSEAAIVDLEHKLIAACNSGAPFVYVVGEHIAVAWLERGYWRYSIKRASALNGEIDGSTICGYESRDDTVKAMLSHLSEYVLDALPIDTAAPDYELRAMLSFLSPEVADDKIREFRRTCAAIKRVNEQRISFHEALRALDVEGVTY